VQVAPVSLGSYRAAAMSRLVDPVLSARLRELPVYLSPEPGTNASPSSDMPKSVVSGMVAIFNLVGWECEVRIDLKGTTKLV
jgi:hypothetical protein